MCHSDDLFLLRFFFPLCFLASENERVRFSFLFLCCCGDGARGDLRGGFLLLFLCCCGDGDLRCGDLRGDLRGSLCGVPPQLTGRSF